MHTITTSLLLLPLTALALPSPFQPLKPAANTVALLNSCPYPITLWAVNTTTSPTIPIPAGQMYTAPLTTSASGGVSLKISNTSTPAWPITQFEYAIAGSDLYFDISLIDCVQQNAANKGQPITATTNPGTLDASQCPGWEHGLSAVGADNRFDCQAGEQCFGSAYWTPDDRAGVVHPTTMSSVVGGVAFEVCSGLRKTP